MIQQTHTANAFLCTDIKQELLFWDPSFQSVSMVLSAQTPACVTLPLKALQRTLLCARNWESKSLQPSKSYLAFFPASATSPLLLSSSFKDEYHAASGQAFMNITYLCTSSPQRKGFPRGTAQFRVCFPFWTSSSPHQLLTPGWKEKRRLRNKSCLEIFPSKSRHVITWGKSATEALWK